MYVCVCCTVTAYKLWLTRETACMTVHAYMCVRVRVLLLVSWLKTRHSKEPHL